MPRSQAAKPEWADNLDAAYEHAWSLLMRGGVDRRSPFHTPTVATIGIDGRPRLRTVVLRHASATTQLLRFHTDIRSDKVQELGRDARVALHFYDATAKIQVRVEGEARVEANGPTADEAWANSQRMSRVCYGTAPAPGSKIDAGDGFVLPQTDDAVALGRVHFCVVLVHAATLEWLYLASEGHRRASFDERSGARVWLAP